MTYHRTIAFLALFITFGALGVFTEVMFTAMATAIQAFSRTGHVDWRLAGTSYMWMFPIYGSAGPILAFAFPRIEHYNVLLRTALYVLVIYTIEFAAGITIESMFGILPWRYEAGLSLGGYVRLDYAGYWALFGLALERVYVYLAPRLLRG